MEHPRMSVIRVDPEEAMTKVLQEEGRQVTTGAGETAQRATHLLRKHEGQQLDFQHPHKYWDQNGSPTVCPVHDQREGIPRANCLARLVELVSSGL